MNFKTFCSLTEDDRMIYEWCEKYGLSVDAHDKISKGFMKLQKNVFLRIYELYYPKVNRDKEMMEIVMKYAKKIREHVFCPRYRKDKRFDQMMLKYSNNQQDEDTYNYETEVALELVNDKVGQ